MHISYCTEEQHVEEDVEILKRAGRFHLRLLCHPSVAHKAIVVLSCALVAKFVFVLSCHFRGMLSDGAYLEATCNVSGKI